MNAVKDPGSFLHKRLLIFETLSYADKRKGIVCPIPLIQGHQLAVGLLYAYNSAFAIRLTLSYMLIMYLFIDIILLIGFRAKKIVYMTTLSCIILPLYSLEKQDVIKILEECYQQDQEVRHKALKIAKDSSVPLEQVMQDLNIDNLNIHHVEKLKAIIAHYG